MSQSLTCTGTIDLTTIPPSCSSGWTTVDNLQNLQTLFDSYFAFDTATFELLTAAILVAFATGAGLGYLLKIMGPQTLD